MRARLLVPVLLALAPFASTLARAEEAAGAKLPQAIEAGWRAALDGGGVDFDAKLWVQSVLDGKNADAAHTWAAIDGSPLSSELRTLADATFLYLLWNQALPQTFVDRLLSLAANPAFLASKPWAALEPAVAAALPELLEKDAVLLRPDQKALLQKKPWTGVFAPLKAWALLRGGADAEEALAHLPPDNPWRYRLALSAALSHVKSGNVGKALALLEAQAKDPKLPAAIQPLYALQIARLHYQRADLAAAESWYEKVPLDSPEVVEAREELLWVWLRKGDVAKLRGTLLTLKSATFKDRFLPEMHVVRAISDLKLCRFDEVKQDLADFVAYNQEWAGKIEANVTGTSAETPANADWYTRLVEEAIKGRKAEKDRIQKLFVESVTGSLPTVGRQKHWEDAQRELDGAVHRLEAQLTAERRRQWRANSAFLTEAIRKMRFVKIELLSQMEKGVDAHPASETSAANAAKADEALRAEASGKYVFPVDDVDWSDEAFLARSGAHNVCL